MAIFIPPEQWMDISREMFNYWSDLDLNNFRCPADTIGVAIYFQSSLENVPRNRVGVRKNGSTDDGDRIYRADTDRYVGTLTSKFVISGCDANRIVETYRNPNNDVNERAYIVAWFVEGDGVFFDNFQLPDDAGWRAAWVNTTTWYELDMSSVEPISGPPRAYVMNRHNGHWSNGNHVLVPKGRETGPEGGLNNLARYYVHGSTMPVVPGDNGNLAFVSYSNNNNVEAQCVGYLLEGSGFTDIGPLSARYPNPGQDSVFNEPYSQIDLATISTMPDDALAVMVMTKYGGSGGLCAARENDPRSSIRYTGAWPNIDGFCVLLSDKDNLLGAGGKWTDGVPMGVFVEGGEIGGNPQAPTYNDLTRFNGDPTNVNLATGWINPDPDGFTVDQLPAGLSMSAQGVVTGTPSANGTTTVTVTNLGLPSAVGSEILRPRGALFYDDFFQYDTRLSVEGVDISATYGTWKKSWSSTYSSSPLPDLINQRLLRAEGTTKTNGAAAYWIPPVDFCVAYTLGANWVNSGASGCSFNLIMRNQTNGHQYRLVNTPSTLSTNDVALLRFSGGSFITVASVPKGTVNFAAGDRIRWEAQGAYHRVLYKPSDGAEFTLFTGTDTDPTGVGPVLAAGELLMYWTWSNSTELHPLADVGVWPYGGFVEYTPKPKTGEAGASSSTLPGYPEPQTSSSFDWTIIAKPVAPTYSPLYHRQGGAVNVNLATGWTNASPSGFSSGNLPDGLSMSSTGVVTGTPTTLQTTSAVVYNGTAAGTITADAFAWEIFLGATPPAYPPRNHYANDLITPIDLRVGWDNETQNQFFADQLPTGLSLSASGSVTGTPTVVEAVSVTIRNGLPPRETFADPFLWSIFTKPAPPAYSPLNNSTNDVVNIDLSVGWTDASPTGFAANGLPAGLTISSSGVVTGTVTEAKVSSVTVTNDGGAGAVGAQAFVWTVSDTITPPDYADRVNYVGDVIDVDLSEGWILP